MNSRYSQVAAYQNMAGSMTAPGFYRRNLGYNIRNGAYGFYRRNSRNMAQPTRPGERLETYDVPLGVITARGGAFGIGPDATLYGGTKYTVDALSYNNYDVKSVGVYWITALNETNANGQIAVYLTLDPSATVPSTDQAVMNQVSATRDMGDIFFASDKRYTQATPLRFRTPPSNKVNYSTGQADAGRGGAYEEQGKIIVAVVAPNSNITNYGSMFMRVTVAWSSPGAPNNLQNITINNDQTEKDKWNKVLATNDAVRIIWENAAQDDYADISIGTSSSTTFYTYPTLSGIPSDSRDGCTFKTVQDDSGYDSNSYIYWTAGIDELPTKAPNGAPAKPTIKAWDADEKKWVNNSNFGLPVFLTQPAVLDRHIQNVVNNVLRSQTQNSSVLTNQADSNNEPQIPAAVYIPDENQPIKSEIVEQPIEVTINDQPIGVNVQNDVNTKITSPIESGRVLVSTDDDSSGITDALEIAEVGLLFI
ncbi:putative structural protein [Shuangao alphatetra-like virus 1]|uniref:putative structural protein n=1 Tax=Shuangao alphatetra-like virus 1 TaxID=1923464 RepID=UPI00090C4F32|nr:putative structural protein [Shuangao alphatetra-like virus 1]APG77638.1 putative structural protein [Shuangao alphatetra-like virus 1]